MTRKSCAVGMGNAIQWNHLKVSEINNIIIHQTHYEKSDWSRAFNQFTIACELDMIKCNICCRYCIYHVKFNVCLVTKPLGVFSSETKWLNASLLFLRMNYVYNKSIIEFGFCMISCIIKTLCLCYLPKLKALADNTDLGFDNS